MKRYHFCSAGILCSLLCLIAVCRAGQLKAEGRYINLPKAVLMEQKFIEKGFDLNDCRGIICPQGKDLWLERAVWLSQELKILTGKKLRVVVSEEGDNGWIRLVHNEKLKPEGFKLEVNEQGVWIEAKDASGVFYGAQLLTQTLALQEKVEMTLPACKVVDYPELHYRGAMLDVSRNFFTVAQVKDFIDMLAMHRLNYFHWHLTDDQGWRIEIRKYPKLTEVGAWKKEGDARKGGFYTQEDIKEVVDYASLRGITVIPEIDLPGHSTAILASYPELGCTGGPYQVAVERGGVHKDVLCLGNEKTYSFIKEVLMEVAALFPAPYIHIGGDEVPRVRWMVCPKCQRAIADYGLKDRNGHSAEDLLQGEFNRQIAGYLKTIGKQMVGWDEVLVDNIDKETVIMSWRGLGRGVKALKAGHPVIFSSNGHFYLNNYQAEDMDKEPVATGGLVEMQKVYEADWNSPELTEADKKRILGAEVCLWTSNVEDSKTLEYMMLPRLAAFSELAWSGSRRKGYSDFLNRLPDLLKLYCAKGWKFASHYFKVETEFQSDVENRQLFVKLRSVPEAKIYYTLDGSSPFKSTLKYASPIRTAESMKLTAIAYSSSGLVSDTLRTEVNVNKATFCPVVLNTSPAERYEGNAGRVLVDGVRSKMFHTTGMWVGYSDQSMEVVIDLRKESPCKEVVVSSLTDMSSYIMGIKELEVLISLDGINYRKVSSKIYPEPQAHMEGKKKDDLKLSFDERNARYIKVCAKGFEALPAWHSGAGATPFLFVDEIEID